MTSVWEIILTQRWLLGGFLSVVCAFLSVVGLTLQKSSQYHLVSELDPDSREYVVPKWSDIRRLPRFWLGVVLYVASSPMGTEALFYAPETTVVPLGAIAVVLNFVLAYGFLNERFSRKDIAATFVCVLGAAVMNCYLPPNIPGYMENFPYIEALHFCEGLTSNVGFAAYLLVWGALLLTCLFLLSSVKESKPVALPILVGLLVSQYHFMTKIAGTLVLRGRSEPEIWTNPLTYKLMLAVVSIFMLSVYATCEGQRYLAARFFLPASFVVRSAMILIQGLLFFREWEDMTLADMYAFTAACFISVTSVYAISSEHKVYRDPEHSPLNSPLLKQDDDDVVAQHHNVLEIMDEYRFQLSQPKDALELQVEDMTVPFRGNWRLLPVLVTFSAIALPVLLWQVEYVFSAFSVLTLYAIYNGWKMGMHIAVYSYVGIKKVKHFENADFQALHKAQRKDNRSSKVETYPKWEDVCHFVILPNYKEDLEVLKLAIRSIAKSKIAVKQIVLVLAMEAREEGSREKAESLKSEFDSQFQNVAATFHPPGIPGETPGKSSNTKWAANQLFDNYLPKYKINTSNAIFTVADADSEFHPEYFAALTYYFVNSGSLEGQTPLRYLTIWQPPIFHYKNYIQQPAIVKLASFITSQHELANLADPFATRVPYSTYSISASLAKAVNGWDPDWISEDWHMALKCFLATSGRLNVTPIFYPILNYSPEGDNMVKTLRARWTQAKRHALGFSELVYFHDHLPRIVSSTKDRRQRFRLIWRAFFLWFKLIMIHLVMATFWAVGPFNAILIAWFVKHEQPQDLNINSWTFLLNCVCQLVSFLSFNALFIVSVLLYESVKDRVDGSNDPKLSMRWKSPLIHGIVALLQSMICLPVFFTLAAVAEWIAAVKTAVTHKFDYEVALKPNLSKEMLKETGQQ